jgi:phage protein D
MAVVNEGRTASVALTYNGKVVSSTVLDQYLIDFTYSDGYNGQIDTITITLDDRNNDWIKGWVPYIDDKIRAEIVTRDWHKNGEVKKLVCGTFYVKAFRFTGKPDMIVIEASALPLAGQSTKQQKRSKSYEKVRLQTVAADIAKRSGLTLSYNAKVNPQYERLDQSDETDFEFLIKTCQAEGISVKLSGKKLVLFSELDFENNAPVMDIVRGKSDILSYEFSRDSESAAYGKAIVSYTTAKSKTEKSKTVTGTYSAPGMSKYPTLRLNEQAGTVAEATRIARNRLREQNKKSGKAKLEMSGDTRLAAGVTVNVLGIGYYSGKYIIESAEHHISSNSPYTTTLEIRKVLGW